MFNVPLSQPDVIVLHAIVFSRLTFVDSDTMTFPNAFQSSYGSSTFSSSICDVLHTFCVICDRDCSKICEGAHLFYFDSIQRDVTLLVPKYHDFSFVYIYTETIFLSDTS